MADFSTDDMQKQMWALVVSDGNEVFYFLNVGRFSPDIQDMLTSTQRLMMFDHQDIQFAVSVPPSSRDFFDFFCGTAGDFIYQHCEGADDPLPTFIVIPEADGLLILYIMRGEPQKYCYSLIKDNHAIANAIAHGFDHESLVPLMISMPEVVPESDVNFAECKGLWDRICNLLHPYDFPKGVLN